MGFVILEWIVIRLFIPYWKYCTIKQIQEMASRRYNPYALIILSTEIKFRYTEMQTTNQLYNDSDTCTLLR